MDSPNGPLEPFCPYFHHAVELIGRRWTGAILRALHAGVTRFTDLTHTVPGLSDRMLSERLKELEAEGIVERRVIPETPVRVEYLLTAKGHALSGVMDAVSAWATEWHDGKPADEHAHGEAAAPRVGRRSPATP